VTSPSISETDAVTSPGPRTGSELSQQRVLVVDDDDSQRHDLTAALAPRFRTHWSTGVDEALTLWRSVGPDLVVIGLELPGVGLETLLEIRRTSTVPVIVVSGDDRDDSCVLALRLGADDYVVKPFNIAVLVARVETVLRRGVDTVDPMIISGSDDLRIDLGARQVFVEGDEVRLTPIEFDVLAQLASQPRQVFSREHLLQAVWDSNPDWQSLATVTEHVRRLRQKLGPAKGHITTVFGRGYRFDL
jgi:two-component system phosphate regulon response regulator PhoB